MKVDIVAVSRAGVTLQFRGGVRGWRGTARILTHDPSILIS